jgi:hypothetical protein
MYIDYLNAIMWYYAEKISNSNLPQRLQQPTPRKIRNECASVYRSRPEIRDVDMLKRFFEVHDETALLRTIENFDLDKFRPLVNYLKGVTVATDDKNIELLGWLLDFPKRPFDAGYDYEAAKNSSTKNGINPIGGGKPVADVNNRPDGNGKSSLDKKKWSLVAGIVILLGVGAVIYFSNGRDRALGVVAPIQKECMVWADNHYERVSCDSPAIVGDVWPLDISRLNNLHRITRVDTITEKHIGKLWYQKRGIDSLDCYTAGGRDPNDPNRDLKRLSKEVFYKHLRKKIQ